MYQNKYKHIIFASTTAFFEAENPAVTVPDNYGYCKNADPPDTFGSRIISGIIAFKEFLMPLPPPRLELIHVLFYDTDHIVEMQFPERGDPKVKRVVETALNTVGFPGHVNEFEVTIKPANFNQLTPIRELSVNLEGHRSFLCEEAVEMNRTLLQYDVRNYDKLILRKVPIEVRINRITNNKLSNLIRSVRVPTGEAAIRKERMVNSCGYKGRGLWAWSNRVDAGERTSEGDVVHLAICQNFNWMATMPGVCDQFRESEEFKPIVKMYEKYPDDYGAFLICFREFVLEKYAIHERMGGSIYRQVDSVAEAQEAVGGAQEAVGGAQEAVGGAQEAVGGAQEAVGGAQEAVGGAQENGDGAQQAADDPHEDFDRAQGEFYGAQEEFDGAQLGIEQAQQAADEAQENVDGAQQAADDAQEDFEHAQGDFHGAQENFVDARRFFYGSVEEYDRAQEVFRNAQEDDVWQQFFHGAQEEFDRAQEDLDSSQEDVDVWQEFLDRAQEELDRAQEEFDGAQEEFYGAQEVFDGEQEYFHGAQGEFDGTQDDFDGAQEDFDGVQEDYDGAQEDFDGVQEDYDGAQEEFDGTQEEFDGTQEDIDDEEDLNAVYMESEREYSEWNREVAGEEIPQAVNSDPLTLHLLYTEVRLNGHNCIAFVDTGSRVTAIKISAVEEFQLTHLVEDGIVRQGGRLQCDMEVSGHQFPLSFLLSEGGRVDILIGLDTMTKYLVEISLKTRSIIFGDGAASPLLTGPEAMQIIQLEGRRGNVDDSSSNE